MQTGIEFWVIAAAVALGCLGLVFAPLIRGGPRAERRASFDMQIYRDQLRAIDAERARGVLSEDEAAATRVEISRRLLAAADAEAEEAPATRAPRRLTRWAALGTIAALLLAAGGLYRSLGAPGLPDQPLAARTELQAAARDGRPSQEDAEAMAARDGAPATAPGVSADDRALVARLEKLLASRPDDLEGHRLLARSLGSLGRWQDARVAQARVVELLGATAAAADLVDLAELMVLAAGGYVSPEARAALARALTLEPTSQVGRYYAGLSLLQDGRPDEAHRLWSALVAEGPADAPWVGAIQAQIAAAESRAGLPGPAPAEVEAAAAMPEAERQAMIEGMVGQLADRLAAEGGPPEDWARLIRSLAVLGRRDDAAAVWQEARTVHAADPAALGAIAAAAREAGLE